MSIQKDPQEPSSYKLYGFGRTNLYILLFALALIVVGYVLMSGGHSPDGVSFNPEVFSFRRIRLAPVVTTLGYLGVVVAILYRPGKKEKS